MTLLICQFSFLQNEKSREEISNLSASGNKEELKKRLSTRMEFGTAGIWTLKLQPRWHTNHLEWLMTIDTERNVCSQQRHADLTYCRGSLGLDGNKWCINISRPDPGSVWHELVYFTCGKAYQ